MKLKNNSHKMRIENKNGFTLLETLIAMVVLLIGVLSIAKVQTSSLNTNFIARNITMSAFQGTGIVEKLMAEDYAGVDTVGSPYTVTDGKFEVKYTVSANDIPIPNVKTITITNYWVDGKLNTRGPRTYVYYKADKI